MVMMVMGRLYSVGKEVAWAVSQSVWPAYQITQNSVFCVDFKRSFLSL